MGLRWGSARGAKKAGSEDELRCEEGTLEL